MGTINRPGASIDREHVTLADEVACLYWETKLGATRGDIRSAIERVGAAPADVERWLTDARKNHIRPAPAAPN